MADLDNGFNVIIIGAGSTGLLLAQGLKKNGIPASVYEREALSTYRTRPREWGMTLHWGSEYISKCVPPAMVERMNDEICCDPFYGDRDNHLPHFNGKTGEKIFEMKGDEPRRVSRRKLRNFLAEGLDVHYGKRLANVSYDDVRQVVTANFEDGTTATGSVLVGCDGARSVVREALLGKDAAALQDLDIQMINISCSYSAETSRLLRTKHPCFKLGYQPDQGTVFWQSIQDVTDPDKPETWLHQNILLWKGYPRPEDLPDQTSRTAYLKEKASAYADPWKAGALGIPDDLTFGVDRISAFTPSMSWSHGLGGMVTIAGDAAHAMPPHRGQGLNNASHDAASLVDELTAAKTGKKGLTDALRAYEDDMRERAVTEIPISITQANMAHNWETLMNSPVVKMGMYKLRQGRREEKEKVNEKI